MSSKLTLGGVAVVGALSFGLGTGTLDKSANPEKKGADCTLVINNAGYDAQNGENVVRAKYDTGMGVMGSDALDGCMKKVHEDGRVSVVTNEGDLLERDKMVASIVENYIESGISPNKIVVVDAATENSPEK